MTMKHQVKTRRTFLPKIWYMFVWKCGLARDHKQEQACCTSGLEPPTSCVICHCEFRNHWLTGRKSPKIDFSEGTTVLHRFFASKYFKICFSFHLQWREQPAIEWKKLDRRPGPNQLGSETPPGSWKRNRRIAVLNIFYCKKKARRKQKRTTKVLTTIIYIISI